MTRIVCIGDSITFGQLLDDHRKAWPYLLTGYEIEAAGIPSDTTRLGLERFPEAVQSRKPQGVVIQFGHNDCNRWDTDGGLFRVSMDAYEANLHEMIERCFVFKSFPLLCTLTPSHRSERHAADVRRYNEIVHSVSIAQKVPLIDVREAFGDGDGLLMEDGLHLNFDGHQRYAVTVQKALHEWVPA